MKTTLTLLLMVLMVSFGFSQEQPFEDFESEGFTQIDADGILATPTTIEQRLIRKISYHASDERYDSTQYFFAEADDGFHSIQTTYQKLGDEDLIYHTTDTLEFDNQDRQILDRKFRWDNDLAIFVPEFRNSTEYFGTDTKKRLLQKYDTANNQWKDHFKTTEIFFPNGELKESSSYSWDDDTNDWSLTRYSLNNENGFLLESLVTYNSIVGSFFKTKTFYERDVKNRVLMRREMLLDTTSGLFYNTYLQKHVWDGDSLETIYYYHYYDDAWVYKTKSIRHYNDNGQIVSLLTLDSLDLGLYQNKRLKQYEYTGTGEPLRYQYFKWQEGSQNWQLRTLRVYTYDDRWTTRLTYFWDNDSLRILPAYKSVSLSDEFGNLEFREYSSWVKDMASWRLTTRYNWYYGDYENGLVAMQNLDSIELNVYPNPSTEYITFDMKDAKKPFTVHFYSSNGAALFSTEVSNNQQVRVSQLASGTYYYIIKGDGVGASGRFVKE